MEHRLQIFVSSSVSELSHERQIIKNAIESLPQIKSWIFEYTPASTDPLEKSYLNKVQECDFFILILGYELKEPVRKEWQIAMMEGKPRLVFIKKGVQSLEVQNFLKTINVKWIEFASSEELTQQIKEAVVNELIKGYRRYRLQSQDKSTLEEFFKHLFRKGIPGDTNSSTFINIDNSSGGIHFHGPANINKGDIVGHDQTKNSH